MQLTSLITQSIVLVTGHYGCGKTNLSINMALAMQEQGMQVTLIDLDIVNPYFRASDSRQMLEQAGVQVVAPNFSGTTLDTPSLSPEVHNALAAAGRGAFTALVDVGGDPDGATALARYRKVIETSGYQMLYVVNQRRYQTRLPQEAKDYLDEIRQASGLSATSVVGNTHLKGETGAQTIVDALPFEMGVAQLAGLPLDFITAPVTVYEEAVAALKGSVPPAPPVFPVQTYVKTPWE